MFVYIYKNVIPFLPYQKYNYILNGKLQFTKYSSLNIDSIKNGNDIMLIYFSKDLSNTQSVF